MGTDLRDAGSNKRNAALEAGMFTNNVTRFSDTGSGCCTNMSWAVTFAIGVDWTSTGVMLEPGQMDPAWHRVQGLVPEAVP
jgi:hypothetical protein